MPNITEKINKLSFPAVILIIGIISVGFYNINKINEQKINVAEIVFNNRLKCKSIYFDLLKINQLSGKNWDIANIYYDKTQNDCIMRLEGIYGTIKEKAFSTQEYIEIDK